MTGPAEERARCERLVGELEQLVRMAARRPQLTLRSGEPGCGWSFNWMHGRITVDPRHLAQFAPDLCRGLALHEATHAAVTRYHDILSKPLLRRYGWLLNAIEDIRIEMWMRVKFPGSTPWIRAYNDVLLEADRDVPPPRSRQAQFIRGVMELWWFGSQSPGALPEVTAALAGVQEAIAAATACQPPLNDDDDDGILTAQRAMWSIVRARIAPTWDRLAAADQGEGLGELAARELQAFAGMPTEVVDGVVRTLPDAALERDSEGAGRAAAPDAGRALSAALGTDGRDDYLAAWKRVAPLAERLGDELLRVLIPNQRLRWTEGHPSGARLHLRRAMQFSADPRLYRSLWIRPVVPTRQDPSFLLLIDNSGSMTEGKRIEHAFDGLVLLAEVCCRIGVHVAAWSFSSVHREELPWDMTLDDGIRRKLGGILRSCGGQTRLAPALAAVRGAFARQHADPKLLLVLSDGIPENPDDVATEVQRLERDGVRAIGLGLGEETAGIATFFSRSITDIPPAGLVGRIGDLVRESLLGGRRTHGVGRP